MSTADWQLALTDAAHTEAAGAALARALARREGAVIFLQGDLGAGKTTFARGLLRAMGATGTVRSPTYTLIEPYTLDARSVVHMDLYRLVDPEEWWALGLDSYPPDRAIWLVEWPERARELLPQPQLRLLLTHENERRALSVSGEKALSEDFHRHLCGED